MIITHNESLEIETQFKVGTLVKFKLPMQKLGENTRYSYSKITKILPKINDNHVVKLHFLTENEKFIPQENIISVERKADEKL